MLIAGTIAYLVLLAFALAFIRGASDNLPTPEAHIERSPDGHPQ